MIFKTKKTAEQIKGESDASKVRRLVSIFFDDLPYSDEVVRAKKKTEAFLLEKVRESTFEKAAEDHCTLEKMASGAGYSVAEIEGWKSKEGLADRKETKKLSPSTMESVYHLGAFRRNSHRDSLGSL